MNMRKKSILAMTKMTLVSVIAMLQNLYDALEREIQDDKPNK